jgi:hypothetical protein
MQLLKLLPRVYRQLQFEVNFLDIIPVLDMGSSNLLTKETALKFQEKEVYNEYTLIDGKEYSVIHNVDEMKPFFMSIVSATDLWLFVSSNGGISSGRVNADNAIFPYDTDDKIIDNIEITGSKTIIKSNGKIWEPYSDRYEGLHRTARNLYKSTVGNTVIFEEVNYDMDLQFRFQWSISDKYGLVKKSSITNFSKSDITVEVLDGVQNVLPPNVNKSMQITKSNLVNAYKRNELVPSVGLGLITLSANIVDRAEPSEALKASTVWTSGFDNATRLMSSSQLSKFRKSQEISEEVDVKGERGAHFLVGSMNLESSAELSWYTVLDINQDQSNVVALIEQLKDSESLLIDLLKDINSSEEELKKIVGSSDGIQYTSDNNSIVRHFANTTFNVMRGGIFTNNYQINSQDFAEFVKSWNKAVYSKHKEFLSSLSEEVSYDELFYQCESKNDADLKRLCLEYMPLTFSRRHGDPSRPWNVYNIRLRNQDGSQIINYEGNWRDIFQNWETLGMSYPGFFRSMFTKFLNASTIDGYNPYRIDKSGVDWEVEDPEDPWAFIGYWGDHQVIYLLKLLEAYQNHYPGELAKLLNDKGFTFSNVPYKIKSYNEILDNPYDTIVFDEELHKIIENRVVEMGNDGKFIIARDGDILKVSLLEKLMIMLLAKLSNYVPGGGIWLNTQRPEWNDANNALVGYGISMVTLYYIKRLLNFIQPIINNAGNTFELSIEVATLLKELNHAFSNHAPDQTLNGAERKKLVDALGKAGEQFRSAAYAGFSGDSESVSTDSFDSFINTVQKHVDLTITENQRTDGLYHAYNLLDIQKDSMGVNYLYEMLEGQVALLSSGALNAQETIKVLDSMKKSNIYREDQYSYLLYPNRDLNGFLDKNIVDSSKVMSIPLLKELLELGDSQIVLKDTAGNYHFNSDFTNAMDLSAALDQLAVEKGYSSLVAADRDSVLSLFEETFNHKEFTGRSGTFFGYEGLGSIYWHMVSKLLLAVQENLVDAHKSGESDDVIGKLIDHYYEIRAGIGINKTAELYGAFPTDPYSHTPWHKGAQQPGMTGQVKEDIISRWGELGISVKDGEIHINPFFLNPDEYLNEDHEVDYYDLKGENVKKRISKGSLMFTYCQVPFTYVKGGENKIEIEKVSGDALVLEGHVIDRENAAMLFERTGKVRSITVHLA